MTGDRFDVVIVGAGHAGAHAAIALRRQGFEGSILIIGRESEPPYERPPLSKEYLAGEKSFERIYIRPPKFWVEKAIELRLGECVIEIDADRKYVFLSTGGRVGYGTLVWAAGGNPRRLACEGANLEGVHSVRDRGDVDRMMAELDAGARKIVIVGGGYIGLEAAAVLSKLGCNVTLLEMLPRVLARVAGQELSNFYQEEHRVQGIDLRLEVEVQGLEGSGGKVSGVRLGDGEIIPCDMVVVGIGISPAIEPLAAAGAKLSNGVVVDALCRTTLSSIYAIGDCAAHSNDFADGATIRLESVQNATDMAVTAAKSICGKPEPYHAVPWFWSNQFDLKLQTVGLSAGYDRSILRGKTEERSFSIIYLKQGRVIALDCVNAVKDYVQGRKLVERGTVVEPAALKSAASLKDVVENLSAERITQI